MYQAANYGPLPEGKTVQIDRQIVSGSGTKTVKFTLDAGTILVILNVISYTSGSLDLSIQGLTQAGQKTLVSFPTQMAASSELQIQKAAIGLSQMQAEITWNGALEYEIWVRGVAGDVGDQTVTIIPGGVDSLKTSQVTITTSPSLLVPPTSFKRAGIIIRNWNQSSGNLFIRETPTSVTSIGWPLAPLESIAIDVDEGVTLYGEADLGSVDTRIMEGGS